MNGSLTGERAVAHAARLNTAAPEVSTISAVFSVINNLRSDDGHWSALRVDQEVLGPVRLGNIYHWAGITT